MWTAFARSVECEKEFPGQLGRQKDTKAGAQARISPFQQVLLLQLVRPDRLLSACMRFVCTTLSISELSPPSTTLKRCLQGVVTHRAPLLLIISPGADPSQELQDVAQELLGVGRYHQVAMGQGQAEVAVKLLHECVASGMTR